jgi:hypothetical protein
MSKTDLGVPHEVDGAVENENKRGIFISGWTGYYVPCPYCWPYHVMIAGLEYITEGGVRRRIRWRKKTEWETDVEVKRYIQVTR